MRPSRLVIQSRWMLPPLPFAGNLRPPRLSHAPVVRHQMRECWVRDPRDRPTFGEILPRLQAIDLRGHTSGGSRGSGGGGGPGGGGGAAQPHLAT
jgi:uncharacterized membrane protein YgcG